MRPIPATAGWTNIQLLVSATGASTPLQFGFQDDFDYVGLEDVSLQTQTNIAPTITTQPTNVTVIAGQSATFSVAERRGRPRLIISGSLRRRQ